MIKKCVNEIFHFTLFRLSRPLAFFIVIRVLGGCSFYAKIVNCVLSIESCMPQWGPTNFEVKFRVHSKFEFKLRIRTNFESLWPVIIFTLSLIKTAEYQDFFFKRSQKLSEFARNGILFPRLFWPTVRKNDFEQWKVRPIFETERFFNLFLEVSLI